MGTLLVKRVSDARGFGLVKIRNGVVEDFIEKPQVPTKDMLTREFTHLNVIFCNLFPTGFTTSGAIFFRGLSTIWQLLK